MKTRIKKEKELKQAKELLDRSEGIIFVDIANLPTKNLNKLRQELKQNSSQILVIKKRILNLGLKEKKIDFDLPNHKKSFAVVFLNDLEKTTQLFYNFLKNIEKEKIIKSVDEKILGGYNIKLNQKLDEKEIIFIGKLPPREIALSQFLGILISPIKGLMYILNEKSKKVAS